MALLQDVEDGDHPPRIRKFGTLGPPLRRTQFLIRNDCVREEWYLKEVVGGLQSRMDRMVTVCKLSMTARTRLDSKLEVEREVRQFESWMSSRRADADAYIESRVYPDMCFGYKGSCPSEKISLLVDVRTLLRGCMRSLEAVLTRLMATEAGEEEDFQRKNRDEEARLVYAVAVSAVAVLALVYLYLVGVIDRGGTKTYSPGSRVLSSNFVSIVLVLAFYVWFKSRDPASRRGYRRRGQTKPEARFKPPGAPGNFSLGLCADDEEAGIKQEIAAFYYGRHSRCLHVEDHEDRFEIPLTPLPPDNDNTEEKRRWVKTRVREVYELYKSFRAGLPNPPVQQVGHDPSVAFDMGFRVEDMDQNLPDNPEGMFDWLDAETQPVRDNLVLEAVISVPIMSDILGDGCSECEPPRPWTSWVLAVNNAVDGIHSEVSMGGLAYGGAANDIPQLNSCEVPSTLSPSGESPTHFEFIQQHSAPMAGLSNVVKPSVVHLCQPQNSTLEMQLALKLVSRLEQQIEEKDRQSEEQARKIVDLEREVERLRSISQH